MKDKTFEKGTFGYDLNFFKKHQDVIVLSSEDSSAALIISPKYQGRVMTSTANGNIGKSFGWVNYDLISSGKILDQINPFGGEERFWIGPEGGQYSIFFPNGSDFDIKDWQTPSLIDTEAYDLTSKTGSKASFFKSATLTNYSNFTFHFDISRTIQLLNNQEVKKHLNINFDASKIRSVAYKTDNSLTNTGDVAWDKKTGLLSIWLLCMFAPSPDAVVVIPFRPGSEEELGKIVNDEYFGKVSPERLKIKDSTIYFKADGQQRGKIGITPQRAKKFIGSYDAKNKVLTIVETTLHEGVYDYVNSEWKLQDNPYGGDAINSYNDGPMDDGSQMGPFYELETSSPAAALAPGEKMEHSQIVYHFEGDEFELTKISEKILGVTLEDIKSSLKPERSNI